MNTVTDRGNVITDKDSSGGSMDFTKCSEEQLSYLEGFISKCAKLNLDPEPLLKVALGQMGGYMLGTQEMPEYTGAPSFGESSKRLGATVVNKLNPANWELGGYGIPGIARWATKPTESKFWAGLLPWKSYQTGDAPNAAQGRILAGHAPGQRMTPRSGRILQRGAYNEVASKYKTPGMSELSAARSLVGNEQDPARRIMLERTLRKLYEVPKTVTNPYATPTGKYGPSVLPGLTPTGGSKQTYQRKRYDAPVKEIKS